MHRATTPTRPRQRRVWYQYPYILSADVLSPEPTHDTDPSSLREEASSHGLCYLKVTQSFLDGTHLARVAASPETLHSGGYTIVVTDAQLTKARPWHGLLKSA